MTIPAAELPIYNPHHTAYQKGFFTIKDDDRYWGEIPGAEPNSSTTMITRDVTLHVWRVYYRNIGFRQPLQWTPGLPPEGGNPCPP